MAIPLSTIYSWFQTGDFPAEQQFQQTFSSFFHKDEFIPTASVQGLDNLLNAKLATEVFIKHLTDPEAHTQSFAKRDASNLDADDQEAWQEVLDIMQSNEFVSNGLIRADKVEKQAITEIIEVSENTLSDFVAVADNYDFQQNDVIAIPDANGLYTLFFYKGIDPMDVDNYLPTGLTNITIAMVQGLQSALNAKLDKPTSRGTTGDFPRVVLTDANGNSAYADADALGRNVANSDVTSSPGAGLTQGANWFHNTAGYFYYLQGLPDKSSDSTFNKMRVQDANGQEAYSNGVNMLVSSMQSASDAKKDAFRLASRKVGENYSLGQPIVYSISPPVQKKEAGAVKSFILRGNALYLDPNYVRISAIPVGIVEDMTTHANEIDCVSFYSPQTADFLRVDFNSDDLAQDVDYNIVIWVDHPNIYMHRTSGSISLLANVTEVDLSGLTWERMAYTQLDVNNVIQASGGAISYTSSSINKPYGVNQGNIIVAAAKSNLVFSAGDNFSIDFSIMGNLANPGNSLSSNTFNAYLGLIIDSLTQQLGNQSSAYGRLTNNGIPASNGAWKQRAYVDANATYLEMPNNTVVPITGTIVKKGNFLTISIYQSNQSLTYSKTISDADFGLTAAISNYSAFVAVDIVYSNAFKF